MIKRSDIHWLGSIAASFALAFEGISYLQGHGLNVWAWFIVAVGYTAAVITDRQKED